MTLRGAGVAATPLRAQGREAFHKGRCPASLPLMIGRRQHAIVDAAEQRQRESGMKVWAMRALRTWVICGFFLFARQGHLFSLPAALFIGIGMFAAAPVFGSLFCVLQDVAHRKLLPRLWWEPSRNLAALGRSFRFMQVITTAIGAGTAFHTLVFFR